MAPAHLNGAGGGAAPARTRPRSIMVKFVSYQTRRRVYTGKRNLKAHNKDNPAEAIYINEDLTKIRDDLCFAARKKKKEGLIQDVWSYDGRVLIKDGRGVVHPIKKVADLNNYCT